MATRQVIIFHNAEAKCLKKRKIFGELLLLPIMRAKLLQAYFMADDHLLLSFAGSARNHVYV